MRKIIPVLMLGTVAALLLTACGEPKDPKLELGYQINNACDGRPGVRVYHKYDWLSNEYRITCRDGSVRVIARWWD